MKNFKYFTILSLILTSVIFVYKYQFREIDRNEMSWKTFKKEGPKTISHLTTKKEMKKARIPIIKNRTPASKKMAQPKKRTITGRLSKNYKANDSNVKYLNTPSKDWKRKYADLKLQTLPQGTKVLIKHNESLLHVNKHGAKYVEKVVISIQRENSAPNSFEAYVNSETGEQINAWNKTHHENVDDVLFSKKL